VDGRTNGHLRPTLLGRLGGVDLKRKQCVAVSINLAVHRYGKLTCHMRSHSVTCHPAEVWIPPLPPAESGTRFSNPGGMQGWVDLCYVKADRLWFEPATCQSKVQRPTAAPTRNSMIAACRPLNVHADLCKFNTTKPQTKPTTWTESTGKAAIYHPHPLYRHW